MAQSVTNTSSTPQDVIEHIRRYEFGIGAELEGDGRIIVDGLVRKYRSLLETVAKDLNSKESHFILELVQNAEDNHYASGTAPSLSFRLDPSELVITNNELGFNADNVRALCSAGESSKKNKAGYIGEKGIGFKSVFKVTDTPEIHSNGYHFRFDLSNPADPLGYVVPHWIPTRSDFVEDTTMVVLPAKPGRGFLLSLLKDVDATLLLFLEKLRLLEAHTGTESFRYERTDASPFTTLTTVEKLAGAKETRKSSKYLRTKFTLDMTSIAEPKREKIAKTDFVLAFPLSDDNAAAPIPACPTYAFLPIREFGFNFYIQADFVLVSSREGIHEELPWNVRLRDAIAPAFVLAIEQFKAHSALASSYLKFLPANGDVADPFFKPVLRQIIDALKKTACIPVEGGGWRKPAEVLLAPSTIRDLFSSKDAVALFGADYPAPGLVPPVGGFERLSCRNLLISEVLDVFGKHSEWFKRTDLDWKIRFYKFIAQSPNRADFVAAMLKLPCLPASNGEMAVPDHKTVFYPLGSGRKYGFEHELVVLDSEFYERLIELAPDAQDMLDDLKVQHDQPYELIRHHILKHHTAEGITAADQPALLGHVRYIRDKLDAYLAKAKETESAASALKLLREGLYLGSKHTEGGTWYFERPGALYLSENYRPEFNIEGLLADKVPPGKLLSEKYIVKPRPKAAKDVGAADLAHWRDFFVRIGVHNSPMVVRLDSGDVTSSDELAALLSAEDPTVRRATLECLDKHWSSYTDLTSYQLKIGRTSQTAKTQFASRLRAAIAPTKRRASTPLEQTYHDRSEIRSLLGGNLVYVEADIEDERFLAACGITYKVDASACLKRLRQVRESSRSTKDQIRRIYRQLELLWTIEQHTIESAFTNEQLIGVGRGDAMSWVLSRDACWRPTGVRFLDAKHPPLVAQYGDHATFFTRLLHVPFELALDKWVEGLSELESIDSIREREDIALVIYRRLSRELTTLAASNTPVPTPAWLSKVKSQTLFLNQHGLLVANSTSLFFNDAPDYAALFDTVPGLSLLAVPPEHFSAVAPLLSKAGIRTMSASLEIEVAPAVRGVLDENLTQKVRDMFMCIARIVYGQSHERFETAITKNLFEALRDLEVHIVSDLALDVTLDTTVRRTTGAVARRGTQLLLSADAPSHLDHVAMEVRKLLRLPVMLSDIISRVLVSPTVQDAEAYLRLRNFNVLPPEEEAALSRSLGLAPPLSDIDDSDAGVLAIPPDPLPPTARSETSPPADAVAERAAEIEQPLEKAKPLASSPTDGLADIDPAADISQAPPDCMVGTATAPRATPTPPADDASRSNGTDAARPPSSSPEITSADEDSQSRNYGTTARDAPAEETSISTLAPHQAWTGAGSKGHSSRRRSGRSATAKTKKGRLLSYAEPSDQTARAAQAEQDPDSEAAKHRGAVEQAAVRYFLDTAANQWRSVEVMPPGNPGFDIKAVAIDGSEELVEIKGQSGPWSEEGVALTPTELAKAHSARDRYWLCVVEHALDDNRRQLSLIRDPFGLTMQFRFDIGWKAIAKTVVAKPQKPAPGMFVTVPNEGKGRILKVRGNGRFAKLQIEFEGGRQSFSKVFNPATMTLSFD